MLLCEFFGNPLNAASDTSNNSIANDVFWFILDHDKLHKDHAIPLINQIKKQKNLSEVEVIKMFMPLVNKGCKEFYMKNDMHGHLTEIFPKPVRVELCNRLYNHYHDSVARKNTSITK